MTVLEGYWPAVAGEPALGNVNGRRPMRVAWLGTPMDTGSVTYIATQLLERLPDHGFEIDCYSPSVEELVPTRLRQQPGLRFFFQPLRYQAGRWYSRTKLGGFIVGQSERAAAQGILAERIRREHARRPYDCIYQMSQLELFALRALRRSLPPLVLHPHTHAAGELRWLQRERQIPALSNNPRRDLAVRTMMRTRAEIQSRDINLARLVVAPSARFADHLAQDYAFPRNRIAVVPNPIDLTRHILRSSSSRPPGPPRTLLFISRISVRKGVEMVVRLSHRLADEGTPAQIHVIGDHSAWSDYRPILRDLHPATATYHGYIPSPRLASLYQEADAVIQPSRFEPFGLTMGEALATGVPVVASSEVGAIEGVDPSVGRVFPDGDDAAFFRAVRDLLEETARPERRRQLAQTARSEAERLFSPEASTAKLAHALRHIPALNAVPNQARIVSPEAWR